MSITKRQKERLWSIILAGGNGERLQPAINQWFGHPKPKQYCTFVGTRSMFQHTIDRADRLGDPERRIMVIAQAHQHLAWEQIGHRGVGIVISQPVNRDTAAGIFLPLTYVRARDEKATVVVYPSDHFVDPEEQFAELVQRAVCATDWLSDRVVLLGVPPDRLEGDYGWIQAGGQLGWASGHQVRGVNAFVEKPDVGNWMIERQEDRKWNTLVLAAKLETLWKLGWRCVPELMPLFETLGEAIGTSYEGTVLDAIYRRMPSRNFSSDVLARATEKLAVLELTGVSWSDWGNPERIIGDIQRLGLQPTFPLDSPSSLEKPFESDKHMAGACQA